MPHDPYRRLLESTLEHLKGLKEQGVQYVSIAPETWQALKRPRQERVNQAPRSTRSTGSQAVSEAKPDRTSPGSQEIASPTPPRKSYPPSQSPPSAPELFKADASKAPQAESGPTQPPEPLTLDNPQTQEERDRAMEELRQKALVCQRCPNLAAARKNVVFGVGDPHADLMFVGEAPGADEDEQAEPFVGRAGQLLTKIIETMGYSRNRVYIANVLKCRPDTPNQRTGNRKPTPQEMATCLPYLLRQIDLIQPKVLVALGSTALEGLTGRNQPITKVRGQFQTFRGVPLMPTFHPSYLLRNQALTEKRKVWEDMLQVLETLGDTISERQRNYFLKRNSSSASS